MPDDLTPQQKMDPQQLFQVMTTEHYNLQSARTSTISEANGRSSLFLTTVSSGLVALAFVGQRSNNEAFALFALVLFPALFFLGIVTFVRLLETSIEDLILLQGIIRIHHYYVEIAPEVARYLVTPIHDDWKGMSQSLGITLPRGQLWLTTPGMISVINGILAGSFIGIALAAFVPASTIIYIAASVIVFVVTIMLQTRFQIVQRAKAHERIATLFPSPKETSTD